MSEKEKILIVDDEQRDVKPLKAMLAVERYELEGAVSGEEALEMVERFEPDDILLDVMMPGMSGLAVCRRLKGEEQTRAIPVLIVTALSERSHRIQAMAAGCTGYIPKPIKTRAFPETIKGFLDGHPNRSTRFSTSTGKGCTARSAGHP